MDDDIKIKYYDILNSVKMEYLKADIPYNIVNDRNIILTYNEINLKYIANKNYFAIINKTNTNVSKQNSKDLAKNNVGQTGSNKFKSEKTEHYLKKKENHKKGGMPIMIYF